jgi:hypothetical protein
MKGADLALMDVLRRDARMDIAHVPEASVYQLESKLARAAMHHPADNPNTQSLFVKYELFDAYPTEYTPLQWVTRNKKLAHLAPVLLADARLDLSGDVGTDALVGSATCHEGSGEGGNPDVLRILLADHRVDDPNRPSNYGRWNWPPLLHAAYSGCPECVSVLLADARVDCSLRNEDGQSALDLARARAANLKIYWRASDQCFGRKIVEMLEGASIPYNAAIVIQKRWRMCIRTPAYRVCKNRLLDEFEQMNNL